MPFPSADFEFSMESVLQGIDTIGGPFLLGCGILASGFSAAGYSAIRLIWRWHVLSRWKKRKLARNIVQQNDINV